MIITMKIIELGKGMVKIEPCYVSKEDRRYAILFEPTDTPHEIGILTGDKAGPYMPNDDATLLILGSIESAEVLAEQLRRSIETMRIRCAIA